MRPVKSAGVCGTDFRDRPETFSPHFHIIPLYHAKVNSFTVFFCFCGKNLSVYIYSAQESKIFFINALYKYGRINAEKFRGSRRTFICVTIQKIRCPYRFAVYGKDKTDIPIYNFYMKGEVLPHGYDKNRAFSGRAEKGTFSDAGTARRTARRDKQNGFQMGNGSFP